MSEEKLDAAKATLEQWHGRNCEVVRDGCKKFDEVPPMLIAADAAGVVHPAAIEVHAPPKEPAEAMPTVLDKLFAVMDVTPRLATLTRTVKSLKIDKDDPDREAKLARARREGLRDNPDAARSVIVESASAEASLYSHADLIRREGLPPVLGPWNPLASSDVTGQLDHLLRDALARRRGVTQLPPECVAFRAELERLSSDPKFLNDADHRRRWLAGAMHGPFLLHSSACSRCNKLLAERAMRAITADPLAALRLAFEAVAKGEAAVKKAREN